MFIYLSLFSFFFFFARYCHKSYEYNDKLDIHTESHGRRRSRRNDNTNNIGNIIYNSSHTKRWRGDQSWAACVCPSLIIIIIIIISPLFARFRLSRDDSRSVFVYYDVCLLLFTVIVSLFVAKRMTVLYNILQLYFFNRYYNMRISL